MTNSTIKILQQNIKKYRKLKGFSQVKLALAAEVSQDYITAIECGKRTPSMKRFVQIAEALKVEPYKFFVE